MSGLAACISRGKSNCSYLGGGGRIKAMMIATGSLLECASTHLSRKPN